MPLDRRQFLARTGLGLAAAGVGAPLLAGAGEDAAARRRAPGWAAVRGEFDLEPRLVHLGGLLLASHPRPVRAAIERHRRGLDRNPVDYLHGRGPALEAAVLRAAAGYLGGSPADIALTDSTTMGLGLLYNGLDLRAGQEVVTTEHDFFATHDALATAAARTGATVRRIRLYERLEAASEEEITESVRRAVGPATRAVAITWVHSSTGLKLPVRRIADMLTGVNRDRPEAERVLLCVDGVHGLGVEEVTVASLGADFLVAGAHKWLFGPRGTGLVWGHPRAWPRVRHTIPSFSGGSTPGAAMTPGGFHSFEHRWALAEAFAFHRRIGKARVAARIHELNRRLKDGLAGMEHVELVTPRSAALSAGLVCFGVRGRGPREVVERLRRRAIVGTVTPYATAYARLAPGLINSDADVRRAVRAVGDLR